MDKLEEFNRDNLVKLLDGSEVIEIQLDIPDIDQNIELIGTPGISSKKFRD